MSTLHALDAWTLPCMTCDGRGYFPDGTCDDCEGAGRVDQKTASLQLRKLWAAKAGGIFGLVVACTGRLDKYSRNTFETDVKAHGGVYSPSINNRVDVLVVGDAGATAKKREASKRGIPMIDEDGYELLKAGKVSL